MKSERKTSARAAIRRYSLVGLSSAFFLVGGLGGWAAVTERSRGRLAQRSVGGVRNLS